MTVEEMTKLANDNMKSKDEKIRILRKYRSQLLEDIHGKQQSLDRVDYMICEIKKTYR